MSKNSAEFETDVSPNNSNPRKLGELVKKFVNGGTPSTMNKDYWTGNIPWVTGADIVNQRVGNVRRFITNEAVKDSSTNIIRKGNLLVVSRTGVGKLAIAPFDLAISQDLTGVFTDESVLIPEYLFRYFDFNQKVLYSQNQGTSIQGITRETLSETRIPVPSVHEQTAIATALSDADSLIENLEKLIAKKRDIKKGVMQELLTGRKRLAGFNGKWKDIKLSDIAEVRKGQLITEKTALAGNIPVIGGGVAPSYYHNQYNREANTITISASGANAGFIAFHKNPIFASDCSTIEDKSSYDIRFIYYSLQLSQSKIFKLQTGGAQPHVYPEQLKVFKLLFPETKAEQTAIANIISDLDFEIMALGEKLYKYKMIKQGMMQVLLTGKIRIL